MLCTYSHIKKHMCTTNTTWFYRQEKVKRNRQEKTISKVFIVSQKSYFYCLKKLKEIEKLIFAFKLLKLNRILLPASFRIYRLANKFWLTCFMITEKNFGNISPCRTNKFPPFEFQCSGVTMRRIFFIHSKLNSFHGAEKSRKMMILLQGIPSSSHIFWHTRKNTFLLSIHLWNLCGEVPSDRNDSAIMKINLKIFHALWFYILIFSMKIDELFYKTSKKFRFYDHLTQVLWFNSNSNSQKCG